MSDDQRRVLLCPNCGAPLPPGADHETVRCAFCGVSSAIGQIENATVARTSDHMCPRCMTKLFYGEANNVAMLGCGLCGGIWLENASAQRVMQRYDEAVAELATRASMSATRRPDVIAQIKCAECGSPMKRTRVVDVDLDFCEQHGTWFDAGELERVIAPLRQQVMTTPNEEYAPNYEVPATGIDWGGVAGNVAIGAFELLAAVITD